MWTRTFSCCNVCSTYLMPCSASGMRSPAYAVTQVSWMSVLLLPVWIVDSCRMTSICFPVASTTQAWWKYFPTSMSMAKSKEIEVLLAMLHSLLRCVSLDVLDMLCVCIHITVRPHIGRGRRLRSHERCGVCRCLRWHHPPGGGMMEQGKTAISKPVIGSVTRGREPGPTYLALMSGRGEPFGLRCW